MRGGGWSRARPEGEGAVGAKAWAATAVVVGAVAVAAWPGVFVNAWSLGAAREIFWRGYAGAALAGAPENHASATLWRARAALERGEPDRALALLADAVAVHPSDSALAVALGDAHARAGRLDAAAEEWRRAGAERRLFEAGQAAERRKDWSVAAALYEEVVALEPRHHAALAGLGRAVYRAQGDEERALGYLERAALLQPDEVWTYLEAAEIHRTAKRYAQALSWLEAARKAAPTDERPLVFIGQLWYVQGKHADAEAYLVMAVALNPRSVLARSQLGRTYHALGKLDAAEAELQAALALAPGDRWAHELLGRVYLDRGQLDEALREFRVAVDAEPGYAFGYALVGDVHLRRRQYDEAADWYRRALEIDHNLAYARGQLGRTRN